MQGRGGILFGYVSAKCGTTCGVDVPPLHARAAAHGLGVRSAGPDPGFVAAAAIAARSTLNGDIAFYLFRAIAIIDQKKLAAGSLALAKRILEDLVPSPACVATLGPTDRAGYFSGSEGELTDGRSNSLQTSFLPWIALFDGPLQPFPLSRGSYEQFNLSSTNRHRHWRNCRRFSWMHASNYSSTGRYRHYVGGANNDGRKRHQSNNRARHHRSNQLGDRRARDWFEPRWYDGLGSGRCRR